MISGLSFLREFIRTPTKIGAIAPSSRVLARMMLADMRIEAAQTVVEYGPGPGAFTGEILGRLAPGARLIAIERNPTMAALIRRRYPEVSLWEDSAENLPTIVAQLQVSQVECIVSGLPWACFAGGLQDRILAATQSTLAEGGKFSTFAYVHGLPLPTARAFRRKLSDYFRDVRQSSIVWRNLPPALVYHCTR